MKTPGDVLFGARIELYEGDGPAQKKYVGAFYREDAFVGRSVPAEGALVAVISLVGAGAARVWPGGPVFLKVHHLEHFPALVDSGDEPGVIVVMHAVAPKTLEQAEMLMRAFRERGWQIQPGPEPQVACL